MNKKQARHLVSILVGVIVVILISGCGSAAEREVENFKSHLESYKETRDSKDLDGLIEAANGWNA